MPEKDLRTRCMSRWQDLDTEFSSWRGHYREISKVLLPRSGRFLPTENNRGDLQRYNDIYDNTGTRALRTLAGGMMAGMTSPARPWFRLTTMNPELDEAYAVKVWMGKVTALMQMIYNKSNIYRTLQMSYEELGAFGTSAAIVLDDYEKVIHCMPLTIGEYRIATGPRGNINTLYRQFRMTVAALTEEFGYEHLSRQTKQRYDNGKFDDWVTVVNAIEPRDYRDLHKRDSKNMPYRSVYFEMGARDDDGILRETGFRQFPVLAARWYVTGGDIYGTCPGMEALGDLRQLQQQSLAKSTAIAFQANPPVVLPADLKNNGADLQPGGSIWADNPAQAQMVRSAFDVNLRLDYLTQDMADVRQRIDQAFYKDIFMMLASGKDRMMTATEVAERHEEKMLMLGPVLERLNAELLDPLIALTFDRLVQANLLPPIPEELQGQELNVEFVSILAQAQRAITTNAIDRFTQNLGVLVQFKPEIADKFNSDYWVDYYADALGIDPQLIVSSDQVALIRQQRAQAQQQQAQMEQMQQLSEMSKNLSGQTPSTPSNAELMNQFSGY
nr:MAG TPA: head to tail connecting protein [Caudoviricetes sp.]